MFEGLHHEHHPTSPTSIVICDIEQSTNTCGATGALSMGFSAEYNSILEFVKFNIFSAMIYISFMFIYATSASNNVTHVYIYVVTNLL